MEHGRKRGQGGRARGAQGRPVPAGGAVGAIIRPGGADPIGRLGRLFNRSRSFLSFRIPAVLSCFDFSFECSPSNFTTRLRHKGHVISS